MVRSLRLSSFALVASVALFGWGCGGSDNPPVTVDGGTGDRPLIQLDGPATTQQDSGTTSQQDAGQNTCNPSGGNATGGLCSHFNSDCQCPNDCVNIFYEQDPTDKSSGSCWPLANEATPETPCADGTMAVTFSETDLGHCYPEGTITGSFSVPLVATLNAAALGGTVSVTATVGGQTVTYTRGAVIHEDGAYGVVLIDAGTTSVNVLQIIIDDANYITTTAPDMNANTFIYNVLQSSSATTVNFMGMTGTIPLTAAPTAVGSNVEGSFASGVIIKYVTELCGTHSEPC